MNKTPQIDDAGEYIPAARKHTATKTGTHKQGDILLKDIWPEPDWKQWIDSGMDAFVAAHLAMFYDTLGTSPHQNCGKVSDAQWSDSYVMAIHGLKHLFETTKTLAEAEVLNERLAMYLGLEGSAIRGMPLTESYPYFAAGGGGSRRLHAPGVMTLRQSELARWLPKLGWPTSKRAVRASLVPVLFKDKTWRVCRIVGNKYRCDGEKKYMSSNVYADPSLTGKKRRIAEAMQSIMEFIKPNYMSGASNYLKSARRISGLRGGEGYWDKTEELFARAFEAYVQDTLNNEGRFSPWLVHGTLESDYDLNLVAACPYPVGEERVRLNGFFGDLIAALKMKE